MNAREFLTSAWNPQPAVLLACAGLILLYAIGGRFRFRARTAAFLAGVTLVLLAIVSPVHVLAEQYLFSVHMGVHILFVLVAPALLLAGLPDEWVGRALKVSWFARLERFFRAPAVAWAAGVGAMVFWHIPVVFRAACSSGALHTLEPLSLLLGGAIFWWPVLSPRPESRLNPVPHAAAYLFTACLACTAMGIAITFASTPLYPEYAQPADVYGILPVIRNQWGISAAMDQQIGGLLMWVPACFVYLTAILAMFARWYGEESRVAAEA